MPFTRQKQVFVTVGTVQHPSGNKALWMLPEGVLCWLLLGFEGVWKAGVWYVQCACYSASTHPAPKHLASLYMCISPIQESLALPLPIPHSPFPSTHGCSYVCTLAAANAAAAVAAAAAATAATVAAATTTTTMLSLLLLLLLLLVMLMLLLLLFSKMLVWVTEVETNKGSWSFLCKCSVSRQCKKTMQC